MIHETTTGITYSDDEQVALGKFVENYPKISNVLWYAVYDSSYDLIYFGLMQHMPSYIKARYIKSCITSDPGSKISKPIEFSDVLIPNSQFRMVQVY